MAPATTRLLPAGRLFAVTAALVAAGTLVAATVWADEPPITPEVAARFNVLRNASFEEGGVVPAWWSRYPPKDERGNRHVRDTTTAHWGKASALIISAAPHKPGTAAIQWNKYGLPVEGGSSLIVSYWTKTEGVRCAGAGIHFYAADGKHVGFERIEAPPNTNQWTHVRRKVLVPRPAAKMGFVLYAADLGKTWYDDVYCLATPSTKATEATPNIDGRLDEPCWSDKRALTGFVLHRGVGLPRSKTQAWIAYDDRALYAAFRCHHPPGAKLKADATDHDGYTWLDDSIEVFLDPAHEHRDYYQFCVNCLGVVRDSHRRDTFWESGAKAAVRRASDHWTIELAIPFDNLGLGLNTGSVWGINLVRNDRVLGEVATWSLGGFHDPTRFGNVELHPDLSAFRRADLFRRIEALVRRRDDTRREIAALPLPADARRQASKVMREFSAKLSEVRAIAARGKGLPDDQWPKLAARVRDLEELLSAARNAAAERMFSASAPDGSGFNVAVVDALTKVPRETSRPFASLLVPKVSIMAARDEAESFQLVVTPRGPALKDVRVEAPPLVGPNGEKIPLTWRLVDYVETAPPKYDVPYVGWWPDPLLPPQRFNVAAGQRQPLWFTVEVPPSARPGLYRGQVKIAAGELAAQVPVELRVLPFRLPRPGTLSTAFGIYLWSVAYWWYKTSQDMPMTEYARWCEFLGRYRLAPKNAAREYEKQTRDDGRLRVEMPMAEVLRTLHQRYYAPYSYALCRLGSPSVIWRAQRAATVTVSHDAARPGKSCCVRVDFEANDRWAGVACPASGAQLAEIRADRVSFWLRALDGKSAGSRLEVFLNTRSSRYRAVITAGSTAWHEVTIPLSEFRALKSGQPLTPDRLSGIKEFQLVIGRSDHPVVFCIDEVRALGPSGSMIIHDCDDYKRRWAAQQAEFVRAHAQECGRLKMPREVFVYGSDEPRAWQYPFLAAAYDAIHEAAPGYPIMQTIGDREPTALVGHVDIWCPLTRALESPFYAQRRKAGDRVWTYVCCGPTPPYANFFIDQPPTAHRVLFWQAWQHGATGFLYWCMTYWLGLPRPVDSAEYFPKIPIRLKDLRTYKSFRVNGDGLLIYPGADKSPWPSVRLEIIRDGIEDYEYLALLSRLLKRARSLPAGRRPPRELLKRAERLLEVPPEISKSMTRWTTEPSAIYSRRAQIARVIERLSRYVGAQ